MIDVIIPYYNTDINLLGNCLRSIISQTIVDQLEITVVDDASTKIDPQIETLLDKIRVFVPVQWLRYKENRGPGYARQYGIDHTKNEYIMFIDADDMYAPIAAEFLLRGFTVYPDKVVSMAEFYDYNTAIPSLHVQGTQFTWVFAKMYNREMLDKYGFRFNTNKECSYGNEDVGFHSQIQYLLGPDSAVWINQPLYYWSDGNPNSMTRNNNYEYDYTSGYAGYVYNFIYSYRRFKNQATEDQSYFYAYKHLFDIYDFFYKNRDHIENDDKIKERLLNYSYLYYSEVFLKFDTTDNSTWEKEWEFYESTNDKNFDEFQQKFLLPLREKHNLQQAFHKKIKGDLL